MMRFSLAVVVAVAVVLASPAFAQSCPTLPASSPVLAPTLDSIPPGTGQILTYTGSYAPGKANGRFAVSWPNLNEQLVWFGVDSAPPDGKVYYNRRYRAHSTAPWYWQYSTSPPIIDHGDSSTGPNSVLYDPNFKFRDPATGIHYKYMMYSVSQPRDCDGVVLGFLYVSFSMEGTCWTGLRQVTRTGGPSFPCHPGVTNTVPVETVAAVDSLSQIYLMGIEGDTAPLADPTQMNRTQTYIGTTTYQNPHILNLIGSAEVSANGIVSPSGVTSGDIERYRPYNYFMNLDMTYDESTGYLFVGRAYPYPFDRNAASPNTPCPWQSQVQYLYDATRGQDAPVQGCLAPPGTLPNRVQVYKMYIGSLSNISTILTGTWTLVGDYGGSVGYSNAVLGTCDINNSSPLTDGRQQNTGRDFAYVNFLRYGRGNVAPNGSYGQLLAADSYKLSKGFGYCYVTGNEKSRRC